MFFLDPVLDPVYVLLGAIAVIVGVLLLAFGLAAVPKEAGGARTHSFQFGGSNKQSVSDGSSEQAAAVAAKTQSTGFILILGSILLILVGVVSIGHGNKRNDIRNNEAKFARDFPTVLASVVPAGTTVPAITSPAVPTATPANATATSAVASPVISMFGPWQNQGVQPLQITVESCTRVSKPPSTTCSLRLLNTSGVAMSLEDDECFAVNSRNVSFDLKSNGPKGNLWDEAGSFNFQPRAIRRGSLAIALPVTSTTDVIQIEFNTKLQGRDDYLPAWIDVVLPSGPVSPPTSPKPASTPRATATPTSGSKAPKTSAATPSRRSTAPPAPPTAGTARG